MTSAFQTVIDGAQTINFNRRRKVSQTVSRDGTVKATSLGGQTWQFEVKLPDGPRWTVMRPLIEQIEALDRVTTGTIQINKATHSWINGYQGNLTNVSNLVVTTTATTVSNVVTIVSGGTGLSSTQFKFKAGDLIQMGSAGKVYSVAEDVAFNSNTITLNRPYRESQGQYTLLVGQAVTWTVLCTAIPQWTLTGRNFVSWNGPFTFIEA
jgi:hypothetical protein